MDDIEVHEIWQCYKVTCGKDLMFAFVTMAPSLPSNYSGFVLSVHLGYLHIKTVRLMATHTRLHSISFTVDEHVVDPALPLSTRHYKSRKQLLPFNRYSAKNESLISEQL